MYFVKPITLALPYKLGSVNCYLIQTGAGFVLIDSGSSNQRARLEDELDRAGCKPGSLKLTVLTHGDFDHTGNGAYLRETFGARIAMHPHDAGMAERGDMFWNRSSGNALLKRLAPLLFHFRKSNRFSPDLTLKEGDDLSEYGLDARILSTPGHSKGSISILATSDDSSTGSGPALFCGDLMDNTKTPGLNSIMDDPSAAEASIQKLEAFGIQTVYPGHGEPFAMGTFLTNRRANNEEE